MHLQLQFSFSILQSMKKRSRKGAIIVAVILSVLFIAFLTARLSGMLQSYNVPTASMRPTIQVGSKIWTSNLVKPKRFDIINFRYTDTLYKMGEHTRVSRLVGLPGDRIEVRNGDLYVNDQAVDDQLSLLHDYIIASTNTPRVTELAKIEEATLVSSPDPDIQVLEDSTKVYLTKEQLGLLKKEKIPFHRYLLPQEGNNETRAAFGKEWNADSFGPYTVPADHYFVMGDSRHQSQDSRYIGPIPVSNWTGTVLNH